MKKIIALLVCITTIFTNQLLCMKRHPKTSQTKPTQNAERQCCTITPSTDTTSLSMQPFLPIELIGNALIASFKKKNITKPAKMIQGKIKKICLENSF